MITQSVSISQPTLTALIFACSIRIASIDLFLSSLAVLALHSNTARKTREIQDAKKAFRKSEEVGGKKPMLMVTDGLNSYKKAFNSEFYDHHQSCKHVADIGLQESLKNVLERMQGSIRERERK